MGIRVAQAKGLSTHLTQNTGTKHQVATGAATIFQDVPKWRTENPTMPPATAPANTSKTIQRMVPTFRFIVLGSFPSHNTLPWT